MKLSLQTVLVILFFVNLFVASLTYLDGMVRASEEEIRRTRTPVDWRFRHPRHDEAEAPKEAKPDSTIVVNSPGVEKSDAARFRK